MRPTSRSLVLPCAAAAAAAGIFAASSCGTTPSGSQNANLLAPTGLAVTSAADRDVLFIANAGGDELRALNICTRPTANADGGPATFPDGGLLPPDTCSPTEDFHFVPGPIRVFAASVPAGDRPVRLAGVRLLVTPDGGIADGGMTDGGNAGAVLVGGAEPRLKMIDAASLIAAQAGTGPFRTPVNIELVTSPAADVIAINAVSPTAPDIEVGSQTVRAYALTQAAQGSPAALVALQITADASGPHAKKIGRCTLRDNLPGGTGAAIVGTRLAAIPKSGQLPPSGVLAADAAFDNLLYVADGTPGGVAGGLGDGAVEIDLRQNPALNSGSDPADLGAAVSDCVLSRRLRASDPAPVLGDGGMADGGLPDGGVAPVPLRSLALSPRFVGPPLPTPDGGQPPPLPDGGPAVRPYPPGALLLGATADGALTLVRTDVGGPAPLPPYPWTPGDGAAAATPRMEPLRIEGLAREVAFLKPPSAQKCATAPNPSFSCNLLQVGSVAQSVTAQVGLVGVATGSDGATYFVNADERRFASNVRDLGNNTGGTPFFGSYPSFGPVQPNGAVPQLTFPLPQTANGTQIPGGACCAGLAINGGVGGGGLNAGVTRSTGWRIVWHAPIPGLERRGGTLSRINPNGTLHVDFPSVASAAALVPNWTNSSPPLLDKAGGDVVAPQVFSKPDGSAVCPSLAAENAATTRREYTIATLNSAPGATAGTVAESIDLTNPGVALDPSCLPVGVTLEFRTAGGFGNSAWLVLEGSEVRGRAANGVPFSAVEPRFDYPLAYAQLDATGRPTTQFFPTRDKDVGVAFTITGPEPVTPSSFFFFSLLSGQSPVRVFDNGASGSAFAGPTFVYTSPKVTNLVFTSVTGGNSVVQLDPSLLQVVNGVIIYR